jgi:hypothetical protein
MSGSRDGIKSEERIVQKQKIGRVIQLAGVALVTVGILLSLQHYAIPVLLIAGAAAYVSGKKLGSA